MAVLQLKGVSKRYGDRVILREADLVLEPGQRIGVVGVNGSGKSTLLRIAAGTEVADQGEVYRSHDVAYLEQEPLLPGLTVGESADLALSNQRARIDAYGATSQRLSERHTPELEVELDRLHAEIELGGGWELDHKVDALLQRVDAPPRDRLISTLSGGERRRVALVRVLLQQPALLLLDEPTNHLDADTVAWLQGVLASFRGALLLVTHDRTFLEELAQGIVEVEDGVTVAYEGSYSDYLLSRAERMASLEKSEERRLRMIANEVEWASRRPGAQRKHDRARLARLDALRNQRALFRNTAASLQFVAAKMEISTVLDARGLTVRRGGRTLIRGLDLTLARGDRLGVVGPNGCGKTSLLRVLNSQLAPDAGELSWARRTKIALFDQDRGSLDPQLTVREAVGGANRPLEAVNDVVDLGDVPVTLPGFLERFLFPRDTWEMRVGALSGGERARVFLARLIRQGPSVILLDEPTNDLDLTTLRVLEEALLGFDGAAIIVTHDRWFLDRVATSVLAFEGEGQVVRYADFDQHRRAIAARESARAEAARAEQARLEAARKLASAPPPSRAKLSFKEQRELDALPAQIETAEAQKAALEASLADPTLYRGPAERIRAAQQDLARIDAEISALYARWEGLEARRG